MTEFIERNTNTNTNKEPNYFTKGFTTFENESNSLQNLPFPGAKFGLLNLQAVACGPLDIEHEFILTVDHSGSMDDTCSDGRTKMQHVNHTLKNIINYLEDNPNIKANVTIFMFDNIFDKVIDRTIVTKENYTFILEKINKIRPRDSTNIELALKKTNEYISKLKTLYPDNRISHIFMTDGEATTGESDPNNLKKYIDKTVYNYFIGFGSDHDAELLKTISSFQKSSYHYIDAIEKAGLVYGEILHSISNKLLYDCEIVIEHGLIYNYSTNLYTDRLYIGDIVGETTKVYHLFTDIPSTCYVHVKALNVDNTEVIIHIFPEDNNELNFVDYKFRHRTLVLLDEVKKFQDKYNEELFSNGGKKVNFEPIKTKMQNLFDEMMKYMDDNNDKGNKFIKTLCDDIYISKKTFGTKYGNMYINSRQTSQGTQRIYTVNTTPYDDKKSPTPICTRSQAPTNHNDSDSDNDIGAQRCPSPSLFGFNCNNVETDNLETDNLETDNLETDNLETDNYEVSNNCMEDSPYLTPSAKNVMRSISYISEDEDNNEDKNAISESDSDDSLVISP